MLRLFTLLLGSSPLQLMRQQLLEAEREHVKHAAAAEEHHAAAVMYEERARRLKAVIDKHDNEAQAARNEQLRRRGTVAVENQL